MKWVLVCLGILLVSITSVSAQNPSSETSTPPSQIPTSDNASSSVSNPSPAKMQTKDDTVGPTKDGELKSAGRQTHVHLGGITVSAGYSHFSPGFYRYAYPYGSYYYAMDSALWWDPFWASSAFYSAGYFGQGNGKGELRLNNAPKDASVYVNGGYAGTMDHLKSFWLDPDVYDLVLSAPDGRRYEQRVYVLTGKTLKIQAKMTKLREREKM
jgi:hypothetical protein